MQNMGMASFGAEPIAAPLAIDLNALRRLLYACIGQTDGAERERCVTTPTRPPPPLLLGRLLHSNL